MGYWAEPDYVKSLYWYRKAAEQGDGSAQAALSTMYLHGEGVQQNYAEAYFWWLVGEPEEQKAEEWLKKHSPYYKKDEKVREFENERVHDLVSHMTEAELSQAQERARRWIEEHPPKAE
jgi:TPR repeat protein